MERNKTVLELFEEELIFHNQSITIPELFTIIERYKGLERFHIETAYYEGKINQIDSEKLTPTQYYELTYKKNV